METEAKKNHDSVVYKSHEADRQVVTEFARMGADKLRAEMRERGLSRTNSKDRMVALLACNQAFNRGRNVGRSEREERPERPADEEMKQDARPEKEEVTRPCSHCGEEMSPIFSGPGFSAYACFNVECMKRKEDEEDGEDTCPCGGICGRKGPGVSIRPTRDSDDILREYMEAKKVENRRTGNKSMLVEATYSANVNEELMKRDIRLAVEKHTMSGSAGGSGGGGAGGYGGCSCPACRPDDRADAMRYGQPFTVNLQNTNESVKGLKCLLLGITFLIIGGLPCDALRMEMCTGGSNLMAYIGLTFVGIAAWLHFRD